MVPSGVTATIASGTAARNSSERNVLARLSFLDDWRFSGGPIRDIPTSFLPSTVSRQQGEVKAVFLERRASQGVRESSCVAPLELARFPIFTHGLRRGPHPIAASRLEAPVRFQRSLENRGSHAQVWGDRKSVIMRV